MALILGFDLGWLSDELKWAAWMTIFPTDEQTSNKLGVVRTNQLWFTQYIGVHAPVA